MRDPNHYIRLWKTLSKDFVPSELFNLRDLENEITKLERQQSNLIGKVMEIFKSNFTYEDLVEKGYYGEDIKRFDEKF
jgi:hypothetical protein